MKIYLQSICFIFLFTAVTAYAGNIKLPVPQQTGGKPLMETLKERQSLRDFSSKELSQQDLSNLMWAAWGINRPKAGKRTAPSSRNAQEMLLYVSLKSGLYIYNAKEHQLDMLNDKDMRKIMGLQNFNGVAPVEIVFVLDYKLSKSARRRALRVGAISAGCICQNIYLFAASEGMCTVVRAFIDIKKMHKAMGLREDQEILVAQTVGYKK